MPPFDFAVFDEAHKTAGRDGARFALALKDENLPIARRLFMTATPRHYDVARKDKFGESKVVFSMDAPETYGPVVHRLPFSSATKVGIITDYKVIISVVTSEMVTDAALRLGVVLVDGDEVKARQVANQIALKSAIEKYNVSKVFTFHSKVASAKSFTSEGPEGIGTHLEGFHCAHIEGAMTTAYRERLMRDFAAMPRAILSNARCLTEGVDVPAVDMVAFLSPKRSLVDIVQATGRAMRLSPETGKEFGYVLVPLYVEKARGETIEQAVLRSNFDEVWKVLQGLKEQDDLLAQIVAEMRTERGQTGGFDDSRFRERVEILGPELSLETLRNTITAACIDAIGENWFERYGQLVSYKQRYGNCDIPARWPDNQKLATWVVDQRVRKRDGNLESEKVELLNQLSFNWNPRDTNWRGIYLELVKFQKRFGHCRVPQNWKENNSLAHWVKTQRGDYANGDLHGDRVVLLQKIGFDWKVELRTWDERFADLCAFKSRFGHTRVHVKWPEDPILGGWVVRQRQDYRKNRLTEECVARLNAIGFEWDGRKVAGHSQIISPILDAHWSKVFELFKVHAKNHGAGAVKVINAETKSLNRWMLAQRLANSQGRLSKSRSDALNEIGFVWQRNVRQTGILKPRVRVKSLPITRTWDEVFSDLVEFLKLNGHCNVPVDWNAQPELALWIFLQRRAKKQNQLTAEQVSRMEEIGFAWTAYAGDWDAMFAKLANHMRPMNNGKQRESSPSRELNRWMLKQRQSKKIGELIPEREKKLASIGFEWEPFSAQWEKMLAELKQFHVEHGHCRVPTGWAMNSVLANWVGVQRARKIDGKLSAERQRSLDTLGFTWRLGEFSGTQSPQEAWGKMLERLVAFHAENGHAFVPQAYPQDRKLGRWVMTQRQKRRKGKLTAAQIKALDRLNIDWSPFGSENFNDRWKSMLARLLAFCEQVGHCRVPAGWKDDPQLANWVGVQRRQFKCGKLPQDRIQLLDSMGFDWVVIPREPRETGLNGASDSDYQWQIRFSELTVYKQEYGSCRVPAGWSPNAQLANWVGKQRRRYKQGELSVERVRQLESIEFDWVVGKNSNAYFGANSIEANEQRWNGMFEKLRAYKGDYGDCLVQQGWKLDVGLANWVTSQRMANNRGQLEFERIQQLGEIGFDWDPIATRWEEMFQQLVKFKDEHGHTNVPQGQPQFKELAMWVRNQRRAMVQNQPIMIQRSKRLDEIGFVWRIVEQDAWALMFASLMKFKKAHGHCNVPQKGSENQKLGKWAFASG